MKIVAQNVNNERILSVAEAAKYSGLDVVLWNSSNKSIFDMFHEQRPDLVIVDRFLSEKESEFNSATKKYGGRVIFGSLEPCCNLIQPSVPINVRYQSNVALILNKVENQDLSYVYDIIKVIENLNATRFRIYGDTKLSSPYYVGNVNRDEIKLIYKNTSLLIDLYGEHYLNSFLFDNYSICEMISISQDEIPNSTHLEETEHMIAEYGMPELDEFGQPIKNPADEQKLLEIKKKVINGYSNFDRTALILEDLGFTEEVEKVKQGKEAIISERWSDCR